MKHILKESKLISLFYLIFGLAIIGAGFVLNLPGFAWMGVSIVLLGVIVSLAMKVNHLIHLMKKAGLWDPDMPKKLKKHNLKEDEKHKDISVKEKSASDLIEKERKKAEKIEDQE
jgi:hypothetical protein